MPKHLVDNDHIDCGGIGDVGGIDGRRYDDDNNGTTADSTETPKAAGCR